VEIGITVLFIGITVLIIDWHCDDHHCMILIIAGRKQVGQVTEM
jgi:hypothetical protein